MPRRLNIPLNFGVHSEVDKKFAPYGWLKTAQNVRMRARGSLATRNGYASLVMNSRNGLVVAYDLHELNGRLIAFGDDRGEGYPTELFEYTGLQAEPWRGLDPSSPEIQLNPFSNTKRVCGFPQPVDAFTVLDTAVGNGFVCTIYKTTSAVNVSVIVTRQDNDQVILNEIAIGNLSSKDARITFANDHFYVAVVDSLNHVTLLDYEPGVDVGFQSLHTVTSSTTAKVALDINAVNNPSTARVVLGFMSGSSSYSFYVFDPTGSALTTGSIIITNAIVSSVESDQSQNQINIYTVEGTNTGQVRTYNYTPTLLHGPTATTVGVSGQIARTDTNKLAIVVNDVNGNIDHRVLTLSTHALGSSSLIYSAKLVTKVIGDKTSSPSSAIIFGGIISPKNDGARATNVLFFKASNIIHMVQRDNLVATPLQIGAGLCRDFSTNRMVWTGAVDDEDNFLPSIALLDFKSTARRQCTKYGNLLYISGSVPLVYDGRILNELGYEEPGIISIVPSVSTGALTPLAKYAYEIVFVFTLSDGSKIKSPPSVTTSVTMGASDNTNTLLVQPPHCLAVALGSAIYGASLVAIVTRTQWSPTTVDPGTGIPGIPLSQFRTATMITVPGGISNYGKPLSIVDRTSDVALSTQPVIYTQGDRGAFSGPIEDNVPGGCSYIVATESRLVMAGLESPSQFTVSKAAFLGEAFSFSELNQFFGQVNDAIQGVFDLDGAKLLWTRRDLFAVFGDGPDDIGGGQVSPPTQIATPGGLKRGAWPSLLKVPDGVFFQLSDNKLMMLPRGAQNPEWTAEALRETLDSFPTITGSTRCISDFCAAFSLSSVEGDDGRLAFLDNRINQWFLDNPAMTEGSGIDAVVETDSGISYLSGGAVYSQDNTSFVDGDATFISTMLETKPIYPFTLGGHGKVMEVQFTGEQAGEHVLGFEYSLDDAQTFTPLESSIRTDDVGATIRIQWIVPIDECPGGVVFRIFSGPNDGADAGPATAGIIYNSLDLWVEDLPGLPDISPSDMLSG